MTAVTSVAGLASMTCPSRLIPLRPPRLAGLPEVTAAVAARAAGHDQEDSILSVAGRPALAAFPP
jgi:hypothetical protein